MIKNNAFIYSLLYDNSPANCYLISFLTRYFVMNEHIQRTGSVIENVKCNFVPNARKCVRFSDY